MSSRPLLLAFLPLFACSSTSSSGFGTTGGDGGTSGSGSGSSGFTPGSSLGSSGAASILMGADSGGGGSQGASGTTVTTIYADTDTALYALDPQSMQVSMIGAFSGFGGGEGDDEATDCAVNAEGDVYVNSESAVYKAVLPSGMGTVTLTNRVAITLESKQSFYALAFAPPGFLGSGETLVGGDNNGELWSIDPSTGATQDLGNFGQNPSDSGHFLGLSGDIVFYTSSGQATGLATIRSCTSGSDCISKDDYLAGIDMTALAAAYTTKTPATSLLFGVYGGGATSVGNGTGFGELFGLGAWQGSVFGFGHDPAELVTIDTSTGAGALVSMSSGGGWAGAGVSTTTTVTVSAPPAASK